MLNFKLYGFFNSFFRVKKKYTFNTGFYNTVAFLVVLKRVLNNFNLKFKVFFIKKKSIHISFPKAYFKYKTTKHSINSLKNKYVFDISFNTKIINIKQIINIINNFKFLSITHLNLNFLKIKYIFKNKNFLLI